MRRERLTAPILLALLVALVSLLCAAGEPALGAGVRAAAPLPRCAAHGYGAGLELQSLPQTAARQAEVMLTGGWLAGKDGGHACALDTTIHLSIADAGGITASADWPVHAVLRPWGSVEHTWVWRNWCGAGGDGDVTISLGLAHGKSMSERVPDPPTCTDANAPSAVADVGTGPKYVHLHGDRAAPHILPKPLPPALPEAVIKPKNAWIVSDGYTLVAVYAGSPGADPSRGRFAIIRQNLIFGIQYNPPEIVDLGKVGPIRITRAPHGVSRETTAQHGELAFVAANGTKGVLDLYGDRVRITAAAVAPASS